jgi:hypothetical protein
VTEEEKQAIIAEAKARGIPVTEINMTGVTEITIGRNGEILSIAKDGNPAVTIPAVDSGVEN